MTESKPDLGEQAISKVVELGINSQIDGAEKLDVEVRTDPMKLIQGKVDSLAISGEGVVMKQDLRMESLELKTGNVEVNLISMAFGKIEMNQSTAAQAHIVITEVDLNRAIASDYLHSKMQNIEVEIEGKKRAIAVQKVEVNLFGNEQMALKADLLLVDSSEEVGFSAIAKPSLQDHGQRIALEILSAEGRGLSLTVAAALFEKIMELLELRNFEVEGVIFWLKELHVQEGRMVIEATSVIDQMPSL